MKIQNVNRINTGFGLKCIKPERWNQEAYNTLINSNLVKEIDKKYPNASANYFLFKNEVWVNNEPIYTLLFDLNLEKNKIWHFWLDSHNELALPKHLTNRLKELTLEKVESEINNGTTKYKPIELDINPVETNPIKRFFKKYF